MCAASENAPHSIAGDIRSQPGVKTVCLRPQFEHVAQHRDSPATLRNVRCTQDLQGRANRRWTGVVAVVDHREIPLDAPHVVSTSATDRWREIAERQRTQSQIGIEDIHRREHRKTVARPMASRSTHLVGDARPPDVGRDADALGVERDLLGASVRVLRKTERDDVCATGAGGVGEPLEVIVVPIENRGSTGFQTFEDLGLGVRNRLHCSQVFEVGCFDRRYDGDVRAHGLRQRTNLPGVVHADLEDAESGLFR